MGLYRKKPVVIEARQVVDKIEEYQDLIDWCGGREGSTESRNGLNYPTITIQALEGDMLASTGDWIIRGVRGEFYPCKPDIFAATYESADQD